MRNFNYGGGGREGGKLSNATPEKLGAMGTCHTTNCHRVWVMYDARHACRQGMGLMPGFRVWVLWWSLRSFRSHVFTQLLLLVAQ